jgi:two-component system sensor histidine kinase YesM
LGNFLWSWCRCGSYGYSFIVRSDGFIVSHLDSKLIGKTIADGFFYPDKLSELKVTEIESEKKIIVTGEMKKLNLQYNFDCFLVSVLDYDAFYGKMITLERILYVVLLAIFALGVTLAVLRSRRLTLPISSLNESLDEVIATGQKTKKIAKPGDEIYQLEKNYDEMMDTIFELMEKNRLEMEMQRKYELYALQMQVNPHFLYNTLDAIAWMAKIKKQPEIEKLVLNLANFFRLSLHKGDKYVTINHEVELVKAYLEIYEIRFPDKVKVSFQIEEGIVTEKILKLLLQPIVENSLKHAFPEESGKISVKAYSIDNDLYFEVKDDGVGFDVPEDILAIKNQDEILHGYGLFNVNERIRLEYGEDYGLKVYSKKGAGTKITIKLRKLADEEIK